MPRRRADVALVDAGLFASREQAKAAIMAGRVQADGLPVTKAGTQVGDAVRFDVRPAAEYVSRGGHKLACALETFGLDPEGLLAVDVGASTGGFTDVLLKRGASQVTAVDVGYGQLAWSLRTDPRVTVVERTNIRTVEGVLPGAPFDVAVIDVSFVGLAKVLPHVASVLAPGARILALVKPQFEAGKARVGKRGVVRDPAVHEDVLASVIRDAATLGWNATGVTWSPIRGPEGNIEFWVMLERGAEALHAPIEDVVRDAHAGLEG